MNLEAVKQVISDQGWSPLERPRRKGKLYLYAVRRNRQTEKQMEWRYIAPVSRLGAMTEEDILAILNKTEVQ